MEDNSEKNIYEEIPFSKWDTICPMILHTIWNLLGHKILILVIHGSKYVIEVLKIRSIILHINSYFDSKMCSMQVLT